MTFNKKFLLAGVALAGSIFAGAFFAPQAFAVQDDLDLEAVIVQAITITCTTPLDFGNLDASANATVTMSAAGARSDTIAGAALVTGGSPSAGVCGIDGADGLVVDVNVANDSLTDGTDVIETSNYTIAGAGSAGGPGNNFTITLQAGGSVNYSFGADLNLVAGDGPGAFLGTVPVIVTYQ